MSDWLTVDSDMLLCMISWTIRPPCEITDQLAVGTQNCFSTLFYTPCRLLTLGLKQAPRMHKNAPLPDKKIKKISGEGARPPPQAPPPLGRGMPPPQTPRSSAPSILAPSALGVPVLFHLRLEHCKYTQVMTGRNLLVAQLQGAVIC